MIDAFIQRARSGRDDGQKCSVQIVGGKGAQFEFDLPGARPFANGGARIESNHADARTGFEQAADLGLADSSRAHDQALPAFELQEHWK